jgi:hypothetical protein
VSPEEDLDMRKTLAALASAALLSAVAGVATLNGAQADPAPKVTICHGTGSATNPYVIITVSEHALRNGHFHNGVEPGHGPGHSENPDYYLDEGDTCDGDTPPTSGSTTTTNIG